MSKPHHVQQHFNVYTGGGIDYGSGPYFVMFPAGVTIVSFDVPIIDDNILEGNEKFRMFIVRSSLPRHVVSCEVCSAKVLITNVTGFAKRYLFHTQNLTHFLNFKAS